MAEAVKGQPRLDWEPGEGSTDCELCGQPVPVADGALFLVGMDRRGKGGRVCCAVCAAKGERDA